MHAREAASVSSTGLVDMPLANRGTNLRPDNYRRVIGVVLAGGGGKVTT
jgi:hypothetical protein